MFRACEVFNYTRPAPLKYGAWVSVTTHYRDPQGNTCIASPRMSDDAVRSIQQAIDTYLDDRDLDGSVVVDGYTLWCPEAVALWIYHLACKHLAGQQIGPLAGNIPGPRTEWTLTVESVRVCTDTHHRWIEYRPPTPAVNNSPLPE